MRKKRSVTNTVVAVFAFALLGCAVTDRPANRDASDKPAAGSELKVGGIYSIDDGDGQFSIVKILVLDAEFVHTRMYKNRFPNRPATIDPQSLSLGTIDSGEFGIGHAPVPRENFEAWQPQLITHSPVTNEELEGYTLWKESGGEPW